MRILLAATLALAILTPLAPLADATHAGPCTHEWVDGLRYPGPVATATYCLTHLTPWLNVCEIVDPCLA